MSEHTYDETTDKSNDLHTLLNSLVDGERVKAAWAYDESVATFEGPVYVKGTYCSCDRAVRWEDGGINKSLTSFEVTRTEDVTATRVDEERLHALLDSLEDGEEVTAEWRDKNGSATITGPVQISTRFQEVCGFYTETLRWCISRELPESLHSVTVRRTIVKRWERDRPE